jgi:hypothetical protein
VHGGAASAETDSAFTTFIKGFFSDRANSGTSSASSSLILTVINAVVAYFERLLLDSFGD